MAAVCPASMTHHRWRADPTLKKKAPQRTLISEKHLICCRPLEPCPQMHRNGFIEGPGCCGTCCRKAMWKTFAQHELYQCCRHPPMNNRNMLHNKKFRVVGTPLWCCLHATPDSSEATDWKWIPAWLGLRRLAARWTKRQPQESMDDRRGTGTPERPLSRMLEELPRVSAWPRGCPVAANQGVHLLTLVLYNSLVTEVGICHLLASQGRGDDGANHETQRCRDGHFQECPALDSLPRSRFGEWLSDRLSPETRARAIL